MNFHNVRFAIIAEVGNKDRRFGSATVYTVIRELGPGARPPMLLTAHALDDGEDTTERNPEDVPSVAALLEQLRSERAATG